MKRQHIGLWCVKWWVFVPRPYSDPPYVPSVDTWTDLPPESQPQEMSSTSAITSTQHPHPPNTHTCNPHTWPESHVNSPLNHLQPAQCLSPKGQILKIVIQSTGLYNRPVSLVCVCVWGGISGSNHRASHHTPLSPPCNKASYGASRDKSSAPGPLLPSFHSPVGVSRSGAAPHAFPITQEPPSSVTRSGYADWLIQLQLLSL